MVLSPTARSRWFQVLTGNNDLPLQIWLQPYPQFEALATIPSDAVKRAYPPVPSQGTTRKFTRNVSYFEVEEIKNFPVRLGRPVWGVSGTNLVPNRTARINLRQFLTCSLSWVPVLSAGFSRDRRATPNLD